MKLTLDYEELNRIIQLYVCKELGLTPISDIEVEIPEEEYGQNVRITVSIHHADDEPSDCEELHHHHRR